MAKRSSFPPSPPCIRCRLAAIGAVVLALGGAFVYVGGWLSPTRLGAARIINQFQVDAGQHPGFRRNHAKGVCVAGHFDSNGNGAALSSAEVFARGTTPVIGRFAVPGGNPSIPDGSAPVRSMALMLTQSDGQQWRTAMNSTPVFVIHTPAQFYAQLQANQPDPATGKPDPAKIKAFFAANPETKPFQEWVAAHPPSSSLVNASYYSIDAFRFTNARGQTNAVRWSVVPEAAYSPVTPQQTSNKDFLSTDLVNRMQQGPQRWRLILTVAAPGDPTGDATIQWPADRKQIDAGTLVLDHTDPQVDGDCRDVNFDPTILPAGIKPSDDPLLAARSSVYSVSFNRRTREEAEHGAADHKQSSGAAS
jgi:catalase